MGWNPVCQHHAPDVSHYSTAPHVLYFIVLYLSIFMALFTAWAFQKRSRPQQLAPCRSLHAEALQATVSETLAWGLYVTLEQDSNTWPSGWKASTLPMHHHAQHIASILHCATLIAKSLLASASVCLLDGHQSVHETVAWLVCNKRKYNHVQASPTWCPALSACPALHWFQTVPLFKALCGALPE